MPRRAATFTEPANFTEDKSEVKTKDDLREEAINGVFQIGQMGCVVFGQFADAGAIGIHGGPIAHEIAGLAKQQPKVAKYVDLLIEVGPYAGLMAAVMPFAMQIAVNHNAMKAEMVPGAGVVNPEALASQMKTSILRQQMEAMRQQQMAEEEMRILQEQMAKESPNGDSEFKPENAEEWPDAK